MSMRLSSERKPMMVAPEALEALHAFLLEDREVKPGMREYLREGVGYSEFILRSITLWRLYEQAYKVLHGD